MKRTHLKNFLNEHWKKYLFFFFLFNCQFLLFAQGSFENISGKVTDANGEPLIGVSVSVKGTTNGAITDIDGNYTIQVTGDNAVLAFSYVGYIKQEVSAKGKSKIDITLAEDTKMMDEIVVVGYGTQRKATLTGAVSSVSNREINTASTSNVKDLLAGKLSGVRVQQRTSEPGDYTSKMDIRGFGTPLIVIDGIIRDEAAFQRLESHDIESISVLKDGAAAVYGVRGGNGVLLVTTRKGEGRTKVEYSGSFGVQTPTGMPDALNAWQYAELVREADKNMGRGIDATYTLEDVERFRKNGGTDWYDLVIRDYSPQIHQNVSASGGTDKVDFYVSLGYYGEDGIWKSNDLNYERYNARTNLGFKINDHLKADVSVAFTSDEKNQPYRDTWEQFKSLWLLRPTDTPYANNNAEFMNDVMYGLNPLATLYSDVSGYKQFRNKILNSSIALTYNVPFVKGLTAKALYSYDYKNTLQKEFQKEYTLYNYDEQSGVYNSQQYLSPSSLKRDFYESKYDLFQASLSYDRLFAEKHTIKALLLYEQSSSKEDNFYAKRNFDMDAVDELFAGSENEQIGSSDSGRMWQQANIGIVGRINYDYLSKYLLELSFREDGSSKFMKGRRWHFFPGAAIGYRISEENFIKENEQLSFISNLKLRLSYASLGDDSSSAYQYLSGYDYPGTGYVYGNSVSQGLGFRVLANEELTWYTNNILNVGGEVDLWDGLLTAQVDFFWRYRNGLFVDQSAEVPGTLGAALPQVNKNKDLYKGFEIILGHRHKINNFKYNISANFAITRKKWRNILERDMLNSYDQWRNSYSNRYKDMGWAYGSDGQFSSFEDIWNSAIQDGLGGSSQLPGDWKYEDWNEDGIIDENDKYPNVYEHEGDNGNPKMTFGATISGEWKNFDFNILLQGGAGFNVIYFEQLQYPLCFGGSGLAHFYDRYHQDENGNWIAGDWPSTRDAGSFSTNYARAKQTTYDASYLRIKSAEIGYTLPQNLAAKCKMERCRIYVSGYNLHTFSNLDFVDPEHPEGAYGYLYPIMKNFNLGLNITF